MILPWILRQNSKLGPLLFAFAAVGQISCGVKGPPLPPLVIVPQKTEPEVAPSPSGVPLPLKSTQPKQLNLPKRDDTE